MVAVATLDGFHAVMRRLMGRTLPLTEVSTSALLVQPGATVLIQELDKALYVWGPILPTLQLVDKILVRYLFHTSKVSTSWVVNSKNPILGSGLPFRHA